MLQTFPLPLACVLTVSAPWVLHLGSNVFIPIQGVNTRGAADRCIAISSSAWQPSCLANDHLLYPQAASLSFPATHHSHLRESHCRPSAAHKVAGTPASPKLRVPLLQPSPPLLLQCSLGRPRRRKPAPAARLPTVTNAHAAVKYSYVEFCFGQQCA